MNINNQNMQTLITIARPLARVLVTGATGFIGFELAKRLAARGKLSIEGEGTEARGSLLWGVDDLRLRLSN